MMSLLMTIVDMYLLTAMLIVVVAVLVTLCMWQRRELRRVSGLWHDLSLKVFKTNILTYMS